MNWNSLILFIVLGFGFNSCKVSYKLNASNIPEDVKTISIGFFENKASVVSPLLSNAFTEKFKDKWLQETRLSLVQEKGDYQITGYITDYSIAPISLQSGETVSKSKLTISVNVTFISPKHPDYDFDEEFTKFQTFESSSTFQSVENDLIADINKQLIQEIYNKATNKW